MNQKGFANIVLVGIIIVLAGAVGYFALFKPTTEPTTQTPPPSSLVNNPGWEKYSDASLEFEYPSLISVKQEGETIILSHSIAYKHPASCDFKGDAPPSEIFSDFYVSLAVSDKSLKDTVRSNEGPGINNFFENDTLKLSGDGYIDKSNAGSLNGFKITSGVEGCGRYTYYFPISSTKSLFVYRSFISEFDSIHSNYQTYLNLPGIISPNQEKEFFVKILSSLKVKS